VRRSNGQTNVEILIGIYIHLKPPRGKLQYKSYAKHNIVIMYCTRIIPVYILGRYIIIMSYLNMSINFQLKLWTNKNWGYYHNNIIYGRDFRCSRTPNPPFATSAMLVAHGVYSVYYYYYYNVYTTIVDLIVSRRVEIN